MKATIYTKDYCSFCTKAKMLLKNKGVQYEEYIISAGYDENKLEDGQYYATREQLLEVAPHAKTVPQIWLDDNYIGGYTELAAFFDK